MKQNQIKDAQPVRVSGLLYRTLKVYAAKHGTTLQSVVNQLLEEGCIKHSIPKQFPKEEKSDS